MTYLDHPSAAMPCLALPLPWGGGGAPPSAAAYPMLGLRLACGLAPWLDHVSLVARPLLVALAWQVVEEMLGQGCRPNERTYWLLVDACAQVRARPRRGPHIWLAPHSSQNNQRLLC